MLEETYCQVTYSAMGTFAWKPHTQDDHSPYRIWNPDMSNAKRMLTHSCLCQCWNSQLIIITSYFRNQMEHRNAFCGQNAAFLMLNSTVCVQTTNHWNFNIVGSSLFWNMVIRTGAFRNVRDSSRHISDLLLRRWFLPDVTIFVSGFHSIIK
jgi:hypothetical protein